MSVRIAAVEFAGDEVRLAVVRAGGRLPKVLELHALRAEYAEPEQRFDAMVATVKRMLEQVKNRPAAYVLCVSCVHSVVRTLTIPFRGTRKVAAAVQFEIEPYLAFPIEELAIAFSPIMEIEGQTDVLAVGVRKTLLRDQLAILEAAGVEAEGVDLDAVGLTGLWRATRSNLKGLHAVLHTRSEGSILAVVHNKTLAYIRYLSFPSTRLRDNPAASAREVQNSMRAFQVGWRGDGEIASLTITGAGVSSEDCECFAKEFDIPVSAENLLAKLKGAKDCAPVVPSADATLTDSEPAVDGAHSNYWEAVIGVALGAAGGGFALNLRRGDLAYQKTLRTVVPHVLISSCLALVFLVGVAWFYHDARARNLARTQELRESNAALEKEIAELQAQGINVATDMFSDPSLLDIVGEIAAKMPDQKVTITELRIDRAEGAKSPWITIRGLVKDDAVFAAVIGDLKQSALFNVDDPELRLGEGKSTFKIVARRKT